MNNLDTCPYLTQYCTGTDPTNEYVQKECYKSCNPAACSKFSNVERLDSGHRPQDDDADGILLSCIDLAYFLPLSSGGKMNFF